MENLLELILGNTLTRLVFFPTVACLPLLLLPERESVHDPEYDTHIDGARTIKIYTLAVFLIEMVLGLYYLVSHLGPGGFPRVQDPGHPLAWIEGFGISFDFVIDGISMPLVVLTVILMPLVVLGSFRGVTRRWKAFSASLLLLTTGMLGTLVAFDLFLFYVFWEVMLVPMYLIIGVWGGERRIYAAVKFFLFTMAGSLLMLIAILWLGFSQGSFSYDAIKAAGVPPEAQMWLFIAFAAAFLIKVPVVPVHTWLPDAHVEAPTGGSVVLAGVMLKLGTYGLLRFALPLFPEASYAAQPVLVTLAVAGILYGALVAWVQVDMKKLVAYSSIAHLGFVVLGIAAVQIVAWEGALIQMVNHGLSTGALFLLVGMLYDRRHTKKFDDFGGLAKVMPVFAFFLVFSTLASVGLPALNGFVGEFLILVGSFRGLDSKWPVVLATLGVVLAAVYLLKMLYRTLWGPITREENRVLKDLDLREIVTLVPLAGLMLWIGVAPEMFLAPSRPALDELLTEYHAAVGIVEPEFEEMDGLPAETEDERLPEVAEAPLTPEALPKTAGPTGEHIAALGRAETSR
jgi:NADH-quinone oxidoreductase subunit M